MPDELSRYQQACAKACPDLCGKGFERMMDPSGIYYHHRKTRSGIGWARCIAPILSDWAESESRRADELAIEIAELRKDRWRLDWLANEVDREMKGVIPYRSLFRKNCPITREAIDAAMTEGKGAE